MGRAGCGVLKSCGGIAAAGAMLAVVALAAAGTVASRPGRTKASVATLALGFACAGQPMASPHVLGRRKRSSRHRFGCWNVDRRVAALPLPCTPDRSDPRQHLVFAACDPIAWRKKYY